LLFFAPLFTPATASPPFPALVPPDPPSPPHDWDGAIAEFRVAQTTCTRLKPARRARAACGEALLGEGETLDRAGRPRDAIEVYLAIPAQAASIADDATAALATYRAGTLLLRAGDAVKAWTALWRVVTEWPEEPVAADALQTLVEDGRKRDARALADQLAKLLTPLAETKVADDLVWWLGDLNEHELGRPDTARALYDRIVVDFPASGLCDDARWRAANLSRALGDPRGAALRLHALLATREVAFGAGSYFSIWLDDSQLLLGQILRDDLHDVPGAIAAFRRLPKDYPASILRDDALYELAVTYARAGDHASACTAVRDLIKLEPDSKYVPRTHDFGCR
jgi:TolA-binding protein